MKNTFLIINFPFLPDHCVVEEVDFNWFTDDRGFDDEDRAVLSEMSPLTLVEFGGGEDNTYVIKTNRENKPLCIITNSELSYIMEVDGQKITFAYNHIALYFEKHYSDLGYETIRKGW